MKGKKKLLSVLLAAALVGQMGVVVGMGEETAPSCSHERPANKVCQDGVHFIAAGEGGLLQGAVGTNYYYPKAGNIVNCAGSASNIIIFETLPDAKDDKAITIIDFNENCTIYIPKGVTSTDLIDGTNIDEIEDIAQLEPVDEDARKLSIGGKCEVIVKDNNSGAYLGEKIEPKNLPGNLAVSTPKEENGKVKVSLQNAAGAQDSYVYNWEVKKNGEIVPVTEKTDTIELFIEEGKYEYNCTVIDGAGRKAAAAKPFVKEIGCAYKPTFADNIKATVSKADNTNIDWTTSVPFELAADDTATYVFTFSDAATYAGEYCDTTDGVYHGYTTVWAKNGDLPIGVSLENNQLTVKAGEVVTGEQQVKLTVSVGKVDSEGFKTSITKNDVVFTIIKAEPEKIDPPENPDPENPDPENPGGTPTDPDPSKPSTGENPGETTDPKPEEKPEEKPENPKPEEKPEDPKPETPPTITIGGGTGAETPKAEIEITEPIKEPITQVYTINADESKYAFSWVLTEKNKADAKTPTYISCSPNDKKATTVTITKDIPLNTDTTFVLTATATPITKAKARTAAVDQNGVVTVQHEIKVVNKVNDPDNPGGTAPTPPDANGCKGILKKITIDFDKTSPLKFGDALLKPDVSLSVYWNMTPQWESGKGCTNKDCTHDLFWEIDPSDWAKIANGENKLEITGNKIPTQKDNKITLNAFTMKTDTSGKKVKTPVTMENNELVVERDPLCNYTVESVTITQRTKEMDTITVAQNKTNQGMYYADIEYSKDGICDKEDHGNKDHKADIEWKVNKVTLGGKEWTNNSAFEISDKGVLIAHGNKLKANNTYSVEIQATAGGVSGKASITVKCTAPTSTGSSSSDDDTDDTDWYQWQDFEDDISDAKRGSTVKVNLRDNTDMPFYIFDEVRGRDVNLQMKVSGGYTWTVNGKTVKKLPENQVWVALGVDSYKNSRMSTLCRSYDVKSFQLENKGSFYGDMKLTMNVGSSYAKKTMFLYSYDEDKNKLTYCSSSKADDTGDVSFVFARSLGAYVVTSKALYGESAVGSGGGTVGGTGSGNSPTTVYPPVASVPASKPPASSSSSSSSSSQSSSSSEPAPPPAEPSSTPDTTPTDTKTEPEQKAKIPVLVPVLILSIAGVITATVLVVRSGRGKEDF